MEHRKIWVDADACPAAIKNILFKVAQRVGIFVTLVANQPMHIPRLKWISFIHVKQGFDEADNEIVNQLKPDDIVITSDIALAAQVMDKNGHALNPRGALFSKETIQGALLMKDFKETLRSSDIQTGGPRPLSQKNTNLFAANLDKLLHNKISS